MFKRKLNSALSRHIDQLRLALAKPEMLVQLAILGALAGVLAGAVILALRLLIEWLHVVAITRGTPEDYESLTPLTRLFMATVGGLLVGLVFRWVRAENRTVGIIHVIERLNYHQGHLPVTNAVLQFLGLTICLLSGHSVGREGPAVHLGAASGSRIAHLLSLPNNSVRILVGAGTAGAIAASFNTPLAGVIFAMEVVLMEYTVASVTPIIIAAVCATAITQLVLGSEPAFSVPALQLGSLRELPLVIAVGAGAAVIAVVFIQLLQWVTDFATKMPITARMTAAGAISGLLGMFLPQIMGVGYDTVNAALLGHLSLGLMVVIAVAKLVASAAAIGLGLPGGLIGPTLFLGALYGGTVGMLGVQIAPEGTVSSPGYYAILGMGATMAATLQAPLAALTAIIELTYNPNIIMPGMLVVVSASLLSKEFFKKESVFVVLTHARGLEYRQSEFNRALGRIGIASAMDRSVALSEPIVSSREIPNLLANRPRWVLIRDETNTVLSVMPAADLAKHTEGQEDDAAVKLLEIPASRLSVKTIDLRANLLQGYELLRESDAEILVVQRVRANGSHQIYGVITSDAIERAYRL